MLAIGKHRLWPCLLANDLCFLWKRHISAIAVRICSIVAIEPIRQAVKSEKKKWVALCGGNPL